MGELLAAQGALESTSVASTGFTPAPYWPPRQRILEAARVAFQTLLVRVASLAVYNPAADTDGRGVRFGLDMAMAMVR